MDEGTVLRPDTLIFWPPMALTARADKEPFSTLPPALQDSPHRDFQMTFPLKMNFETMDLFHFTGCTF